MALLTENRDRASADMTQPTWGGAIHDETNGSNSDNRSKWKPFHGRSPRNRNRGRGVLGAPCSPRAMMNPPRGKGSHHAVFSPNSKEQEMYQPVPRTSTNPFGFENMPPSVNEPQSLADDHPLMVEMAELKAVREKRRMYWAGLSEQIGEEWDNPMSYDRQRWKTEEALADKKFQELSGQIALAERGILVTDVPRSMEPKQAGQGSRVSPVVPWVRKESNARRGRARRWPNWKLEARPAEIHTELNSSSIPNLAPSCQEVDRPLPASRRRGYKVDKQAEAVNKWMDDVSLHFNPHNLAPPPIAVGTSDGGIHIGSEDDMYSVDHEALFMSEDQNNTPYGPRKRFRNEEYSSSSIELGRRSRKTVEDEIDFDVAEARRETQRSRMAFTTATERRDSVKGERFVLKNPRLETSESNVNTLVINTQIVKRVSEPEDEAEDIGQTSMDVDTNSFLNHMKHQSIPESMSSIKRHQELPQTDAHYQKDTSNMSHENMTQHSQVNNTKQPEISNQPKDIFDAALESLEKSSVRGVSSADQPVSSTSQPILVTSASPTPIKKSAFISRFFDKESNLPQALAAAALKNLQAKSQENSARMESVKSKTPNPQPQHEESTNSQMLNMDGAQDVIAEVPTIKRKPALKAVDLLPENSLLAAARAPKPSEPTKHEEGTTRLPVEDDELDSNRHSKQADWMDIDQPASIEVINLQDAPTSESEHDITNSPTTATSFSPPLPRYIRRVTTRRAVEECSEIDEGDDMEDSEYETSSEASSDLSTLQSSSRILLTSPPIEIKSSSPELPTQSVTLATPSPS